LLVFVVANCGCLGSFTSAFAATVHELLPVVTAGKSYNLPRTVTLSVSVAGCHTPLTVLVAYGLRTLTPSEGGEAMMLQHEFRGHSEQISWDDGTEFVATTRVRRPVVVSNRSHAVILLPIHLAPLLPSLVFTNGRENSQPKNDTDNGFIGFAGFTGL
jgi:hypothetical protein